MGINKNIKSWLWKFFKAHRRFVKVYQEKTSCWHGFECCENNGTKSNWFCEFEADPKFPTNFVKNCIFNAYAIVNVTGQQRESNHFAHKFEQFNCWVGTTCNQNSRYHEMIEPEIMNKQVLLYNKTMDILNITEKNSVDELSKNINFMNILLSLALISTTLGESELT